MWAATVSLLPASQPGGNCELVVTQRLGNYCYLERHCEQGAEPTNGGDPDSALAPLLAEAGPRWVADSSSPT
jgi:hypothetical protein